MEHPPNHTSLSLCVVYFSFGLYFSTLTVSHRRHLAPTSPARNYYTSSPYVQVAAVIMSGLLRGDYLLSTPDLGLQFNAIATKGLLPRSFPGVLLDMLVGLLAPLAHWGFVGMFDRVSRRTAGQRFMKLWGPQAQGPIGAGSAGKER